MRRRLGPSSYRYLLGVVTGALFVGLFLPFAVGDGPRSNSESSGPSNATQVAGALESDTAPSGSAGPNGTAGLGPDGNTPASPTGAVATTAPARSGAGGSSVVPGQTRGAADRGVTATEIRVGAILLDLATANSVGLAPDNYSLADQRKGFEGFADEINRAGGINGRRLAMSFAVVDPFKADSGRAACLALTEDAAVFAVLALNGFFGEANLCITAEHATPLISADPKSNEYFARSKGRLITDSPTIERLTTQWIGAIDSVGALRGKTIGILGVDEPAGSMQSADAAEATLARRGYKVAYRSRLSNDLQTGTGQIPLEVQRMRNAGVDYVLLAANFLYSTNFAQTADSQRYFPGYAVSAVTGLASDALVKNMPASFEGAIAYTGTRTGAIAARDGVPEVPGDRSCRERYNAMVGKSFPYGTVSPANTICSEFVVFGRAAKDAGVNLTRSAFLGAIERLGAIALPGSSAGSFGPGKTDYLDEGRLMRWAASCKCYHLLGGPYRDR